MIDKSGKRIPVHARLSTADNPFDPFDEFEKWQDFDRLKGYRSSEEAARATVSSSDWPYEDQLLAYEDAVDLCVKLNLTGNRIKVTREY